MHKEALERIKQQLNEREAQLPFRVAEVGKWVLWIGKNAQSNDELLRYAHKDDLWFHARGVAGSHVLLRMNKRTELPAKELLEQA
ncbi:NFACT RNA binding domain-containing protein, partial [Arthrospira platensis SPKY1]|nr:NFACT RNA binding domain-containing protein [Arthrospira platensis SPKY1]